MLVVLLAIGSVPATIATLVLLSRFDLKGVVAQHVITVTLGAVLLVTALFLITGRSIRTRYADRLNRLDPDTARLFTVALGLTMGVLVTITSVGACPPLTADRDRGIITVTLGSVVPNFLSAFSVMSTVKTP
jgi:uncharacterized protein